jgi:2-hydroxy-6-oxonona-2,4-dienedioate hydrolase
MNIKRVALSLGGAAIVALGGAYLLYSREIRTIRDRLSAGSEVVQTQHGPIEYTTWGDGPAVLVVHGAGGGYDQGSLIARAYGGEDFRWISPSRFGYLRTPLPADASTAAQADAFADLLDALSVPRVAILAMSGGVPPALQFVQRHPDRTTALVFLSSAPYTPLSAGDQKLPVPTWVYQALFRSDFPYWLLQRVAPSSLERMFDVPAALRAGITPDEEAFVVLMEDAFQPVTGRLDGLRNEGAAINPDARYLLGRITAPALVIHSRDDHINPFAVGQYTAQQIRGAEFMPFTTGGHLLLGHQADVRARVTAFLRQNAAGARR